MKRLCKIAIGFAIICLIQILCAKTVSLLHISIPSPILGLVIFAFLLKLKIIPEKLIEEACEIFISNLPLLFIPLTVGVTAYFGLIKQNLGAIIATVILATFITMILTAFFVEGVMKWTGKKDVH